MVYIVRSSNYRSVEYYACATHALRISYDLSTQKLHYSRAMLRYDTLPFLTHSVCIYIAL